MGVLQRFERRLEGLVEGAFNRAFKGNVEPVEIARALFREAADRKAIVGSGRTLVPNDYTVELGARDYARLGPYEKPLGKELSDMLREEAAEQGWSFVGPITVALEEVTDVSPGVFRVRSGVSSGERVDVGTRHTAGMDDAVDPRDVAASQRRQVFPGSPRLVLSAGGIAEPGSVEFRGEAREIELVKAVTVIGRGHDADLRFADPGMSRHHAKVEVDGERAYLSDLGSTNGTTLNGAPITGPSLLDTGQRITMGSTVLVFVRDPS